MKINRKKPVAGQKKKPVKKMIAARPRKMSVPRPMRVNKYRIALVDPFDQRALDVRLPNDFATPTITRCITGFTTLGAVVGSTAFCFTPSPILSMYSPSSVVTSTDMISYTSYDRLYQALDQATMLKQFASWRLVAGGIRIKSQLPVTAQPIVVAIATTPVVGSGPGPNFLNIREGQTQTAVNNILQDITGVAPSTGWAGSLNGFSNFNRFNTQDVSTQSLTVPFRVTDARAFEFRNGNQTIGADIGGYTVGDQSIVKTSNNTIVTLSNDNEEAYGFEGFSCIAMDIKGAPTNILSVLEIEYIYHLEGIPRGEAATNRNAINSSASVADAASHLGDIAWANRQGLYKVATAMTGTLFNRVDPNLVGQLLGLKL